MRLIDADAVLKWFDEYWAMQKKLGRPSKQQRAIYMTMRSMVNSRKTEDAVPVRHGKWIIRDNPGTGWYRITCSECGENVTSEAPCIGFFPNAKVNWNYCPECGARMDEE